MDKKAFVGLWADVFKGLVVGFILGVIIMLLLIMGIIPFFVEPCGLCG